jgi:hypothetical protein
MERFMVLTISVLLLALASSAVGRKSGKGQQEFLTPTVFVKGKVA